MLFVTASALLYNGGSAFNYDKLQYSFTQNFLSDLGRETTFTGKSNFAPRIVFILSLFFISSGLTTVAFKSKKICLAQNKGHKMGFACVLVSALAAVFLLLSGIFPWDVMFWPHVLSVNFAFIFIFIFLVMFSIVQILNNEKPVLYFANIFAALSIIIFTLVLVFGPHYRTPHGLTVQVISQKILVIIFLFNLIIQSKVTHTTTKIKKASP